MIMNTFENIKNQIKDGNFIVIKMSTYKEVYDFCGLTREPDGNRDYGVFIIRDHFYDSEHHSAEFKCYLDATDFKFKGITMYTSDLVNIINEHPEYQIFNSEEDAKCWLHFVKNYGVEKTLSPFKKVMRTIINLF